MHPDWPARRAADMLLDPSVVMLNTGSFGPTPRPVLEHCDALRRRLAAGPTDFFVRVVPPLLWEARRRLAAFVNVAPERLMFTGNVSTAINVVAAGLTLSSPGEVLLTDHEYGAMHWCWARAAARQGLTLRTFALPTHPQNPGEILAAFEAALTPRVQLAFLSHVVSHTGLVLPVREMCAIARRRGVLTCIDGAHAPGMLPLDLEAINADFYAANAHKWLLAPVGVGFLAFGPGAIERLSPLEVSWGYRHPDRHSDEPDEFGSTPRLRHLEFTGTRDVCPWLSVPVALDFLESLGFDAVRERMRQLSDHARKVIPLPAVTPAHSGLRGALTAFELPAGTDAGELRRRLWERRVEAPVNERSGRLLVRVSGHWYTREDEIDRLAEFF